jgi:hypothetical protein
MSGLSPHIERLNNLADPGGGVLEVVRREAVENAVEIVVSPGASSIRDTLNAPAAFGRRDFCP